MRRWEKDIDAITWHITGTASITDCLSSCHGDLPKLRKESQRWLWSLRGCSFPGSNTQSELPGWFMKILCSPVWDMSENTKTQYWAHSNLYGKHQSGLYWKTEMWSPWITAKDPYLPGPGWASFHWLLSILKSPSLLLLHYMKLITNVLSPLIQDMPLLWLAAGAAMRSHSPHPAVCSFKISSCSSGEECCFHVGGNRTPCFCLICPDVYGLMCKAEYVIKHTQGHSA